MRADEATRRLQIGIAGCLFAAVLALPATAAQPEHHVSVLRDPHGVPHIRSDSDLGAFYGLGWVTAEDRLLQMNLNVWTVQGRMAEAAGAAFVDQDRYWRIVGIWRHAQTVADNFDDEHTALLEAYAAGVNDWLAAHPNQLNPLFDELRMVPEAWTPAHSIAAWWRVANLFISDPFKKASSYYEFMDLVDELGMESAIDEFLGERHPGDPEAGVVQVEDVPDDVLKSILAYAESVGYGDEPKGYAKHHPDTYDHVSPSFSHAWAVGGGATTTGKAVLISDPQITVTLPNLFYEWHATGETFNARGVGVAGAAGLLIGFNEHVAWGLTAAGADQRDLMRLEMTDRNTYRVDGVDHQLVKETETITVKNAVNQSVTWQLSLWGPVVTELADEVHARDGWALKGVPYSEDDRDTFTAMVAMMRAGDMDSFRAALDDWRFPSANLVAGDDGGNIFYTLLGALPVRSTDSPLAGLIAQEGTSTTYDWQDTIPGIYKPWVLNPKAGHVFSANHRAAGDWYPLKLGMGFMATGDTTRSHRQREVLASLPVPATPAEILQLSQFDCVNTSKRDMVAILRHGRGVGIDVSSNAASTLDHLDAWSDAGGSVLTTSPGVFLVSKIPTNFRELQTGAEMHDEYGGGQGGLNFFLKTVTGLIAADPAYVPDEDAVAYLDNALATAWNDAKAISSDPQSWDQIYQQGTAVNPRLKWFADSYTLGGSYPTQHSYTPPTLQCGDGGTVWSQRGQAYTHFVDMAAVDQSLSMIPPGNTEGPDDGLWQAQGADWAAGKLHPAPLSDDAVDAITTVEATIVYRPTPFEPGSRYRETDGRLGR
jgi:acyl-homoserine lactone acylase PvdQ